MGTHLSLWRRSMTQGNGSRKTAEFFPGWWMFWGVCWLMNSFRFKILRFGHGLFGGMWLSIIVQEVRLVGCSRHSPWSMYYLRQTTKKTLSSSFGECPVSVVILVVHFRPTTGMNGCNYRIRSISHHTWQFDSLLLPFRIGRCASGRVCF